MPRVSEYIEHHTRKVTHHAKRRLQLLKGREALWLFGLVIIVAAITSWFLIEGSRASNAGIDNPVACEDLFFGPNTQRCERKLTQTYGFVPALERAPVCEERERFGIAASLCDEYDEARSAQRYEGSLRERGVSVWEPRIPIRADGLLRIKTLAPVLSLTLVCDEKVVPANWSAESSGTYMLSYAPSGNATCTLVAVTAEGSITSETFGIVS